MSLTPLGMPNDAWPTLIVDLNFPINSTLAHLYTESEIMKKLNIHNPKAATERNYTSINPSPCSPVSDSVWNCHCNHLKFPGPDICR